MRIAYIAPYQGPELLRRRPSVQNLALAGNLKIEMIGELLRRSGHDVELLSQGEVVERALRYFPAFRERASGIPVAYSSSVPVRFVNGWWSANRLLALFKQRHRAAPFDLVIVYNMKRPQLACGLYACQVLGLPVVLEYEDDALVNLAGKREHGLKQRMLHRDVARMLSSVSACIGASPFLLSRVPSSIPRLLLRGVVTEEVMRGPTLLPTADKKDRVTYSGTLFRSKGLEPLIEAWKQMKHPGWQLHIAGDGELAARLRDLAAGESSIVFHGLLDRQANAELLSRSRICVNPHDLSETPGNVFAFKIIEYLAAGSHVVSTPMGELEPELERGISYMPDNAPHTIATTLSRVIADRQFDRTATIEARDRYGPAAVAHELDRLVKEAHAKTLRPARRGLPSNRLQQS
jgi:glycosyltransferase involved in cell wall biosynthesis